MVILTYGGGDVRGEAVVKGGRVFMFRNDNKMLSNSTFAAGNWEISLDVIGQGRHPVV